MSEAERWLDAAAESTERGEWAAAEAALARAAGALGEDHPEVVYERGSLALARWRFDEARAAFDALDHGSLAAPHLERLALLLDCEARFEEADRALARAHALEPDAFPLPHRLAPAAFDDVVQRAVAALPPAMAAALDDVAVVVDPMPTRGAVRPEETDHPPDLLGLFAGRPLDERSHDVSGELPPTVFVYQRNLERACADEATLVEEIRVTLYHELGHALGFDEDGVDELGLG